MATGDSLVQSNQVQAAKLGITLPGIGSGTSSPATSNDVTSNQAQAAKLGVAIPGVNGSTPPPVNQIQDASAIGSKLSGNSPTPVFPTPPSAPTNSLSTNTSVPNPIATAKDIIDQGNAQTPGEQTNQSLLEKVAALIGQKKSQTGLTNEAETAAGIPALSKTVSDLNTQLEGLNNQATDLQNQASPGGAIQNKEQEGVLGRGVTAAGLAPQTAGDLRKNQIQQSAIASQALTLKSAIYGAQGQLTLAKDAADKAALAQYEDQQNQIDYQQALIAANLPQMNKEEKNQALLVQAQLTDRQTQIQEAQDDKKTIIALATAALKNNPNDPAAQYAAQQALAESNKAQPNVQTVLGLIGKYQSDPLDVAQKVAAIAASRASTAKSTYELAQEKATNNPTLNSGVNSTALNTILGSGTFTKDQKATITNAINNGQDPLTVIKNQAKNIMGQTEATKLTSYEAADNAMKDLNTNLKAYYAGGGNTGLLSGTFEQTINKLGQVNDPAKVQLATQVAISLQAYRNAISGTAYSNQEGKQIASVFPGINNSKGLNDAVISGRLAADKQIIDGIYGSTLGTKTYNDLTSNQSGSAPPVAPPSAPAGFVQMTGPTGLTFNVPQANVALFKQNGYK